MFERTTRALFALTTAAVIAAAITVLPGASESVSASAPIVNAKTNQHDVRSTDCARQAWPYLEAGCIKDGRPSLAQPRTVRIVTTDRIR